MEDFVKKLNGFKVLGIPEFEKINTINEFYDELCRLLEVSNSVYIASLFFGCEGKTIKILDILEERKKKKLKTVIVLDKSRGYLKDFLKIVEERNICDIFHFVDYYGTNLLPQRIKEMFGVFHTKAIICDDIVILSGANFKTSYFENTFDRYFKVVDKEFALFVKMNIFGYLCMRNILNDSKDKLEERNQIFMPTEMVKEDATELQKDYNDFLNNKIFSCENFDELKKFDQYKAYIVLYRTHQEMDLVGMICDNKIEEMHLSTGYLNLPQEYIEMFKEQKVTLYAECPKNGKFVNFGFLNDYVSEIYRYTFHKALLSNSLYKVKELVKSGFAFHIKGIWGVKDDWAFTIIGSSNFNNRSIYKDDETNYLIITADEKHVKILKEEISILEKYSITRTLADFKNCRYSVLVRIIYFIFSMFI